MKPTSTASSAMLGVLALSAAFISSNAGAATFRAHIIAATANCAGPLPVSDSNLRKNPLGVRNEGTANVFVSCSTAADFYGDIGTDGFNQLLIVDTTGSAVPVNCTSVNGNRYEGFVSVAGVQNTLDETYSYIELDPDKHVSFGSYNFSCILPPGFEMGGIVTGETSVNDEL